MSLWWGFFATDDWTLPIRSVKTRKREASFSSGAPVWRRPKLLVRENKYHRFDRKKAKEMLVCDVFGHPRWRKRCVYTSLGY